MYVTAGMVFQLRRIGKLVAIYYAVEYIQVPLSPLFSGNNGEMEAATLGSLTMSMLAGYSLPSRANLFAPTLESRQQYNVLW